MDATANDPLELVKTNVLGTANVLQAALSEYVAKTLLISSDKACLPANAYGASKFMAEQLTVNFNVYGAPRFCLSSVVRYGNVLYSRGSVLTVWEDQFMDGHPLTLTEPHMSRFVITMRQAVHLIESALNTMEGGEVFIPVLPACTMEDLLEAAFPPAGLIYTGLRPGGEKRHELLMSGEEAVRAVDLEGVSIVLPHQATWRERSLWAHEPKAAPVLRSSQFAEQLSVTELKALLGTAKEAL